MTREGRYVAVGLRTRRILAAIAAALVVGTLVIVALARSVLVVRSERASSEARADLARGLLVIRTYGLPLPSRDQYAAVLRERYGIELRSVAGCVVSDDIARSTEAYDAVMRAAIEQRFGGDALETAAIEARRRWDALRAR